MTLAVSGYCGLVIFLSISAFDEPPLVYNRIVSDILVTAGAILLLAAAFAPKRIRITPVTFLLFASFLLSLSVSTNASVNYGASVERLNLLFGLTVVSIGIYILANEAGQELTESICIVIASIHAVFLTLILFHALQPIDPSVLPAGRLAYFSHPRHFGYYGFISASAAMALLPCHKDLRLLSVILAAAALFGIIYFGSRGALLTWIVFVAVAAWLLPQRKRFFVAASLSAALAAVAAFILDDFKLNGVASLFTRLNELNTNTVDAISAPSPRVVLWGNAIEEILERPMFGYGPDGYALSGCCEPRTVHPHNVLLQFLFEFGLVGTALLAGVTYRIFAPPVRATLRFIDGTPASNRSVMLLATLAGFAAYSTIDGLFYHALPLLHFAIIAPLFIAQATRLGGAQNWRAEGPSSPSR